MGYSEAQIKEFEEKYQVVRHGMHDLMYKVVAEGQKTVDSHVKENLLHGVSRRISVLQKSTENIFNKFPLDVERPLSRDDLYDVQINMHAYMINLAGVFDNWAWAFVYRHSLLGELGGRHGVGMFKMGVLKRLPKVVSEYLTTHDLEKWHEDYLKSFRDALAHRIPLYIPPSIYTKEEGDRYQELEAQKIPLIMAMNWGKLEEVEAELSSLGQPCLYFLHSFQGEKPKPIYMHPQLLCDGLAIIEFGNLFMDHWHQMA